MQIWTVMTMLSGSIVDVAGIFSSIEKAKEAAKKEMEALAKIIKSSTWTTIEKSNYCMYTNDYWDVIIRDWNLDEKV
jgi:cell division ATPase FtsA